MTILYYDKHGQEFFDRTIHADLSFYHDLFLQYLEPGAHILDAGCGSGRDTKVFMERGYQVTAFDTTEDSRADHANEYWLNIIIQKQPA